MSFGRKEFFCKHKIYGVLICSYIQSSNGAQSLLAEVLSPLSHADYTGLVVTLTDCKYQAFLFP